MQEQHDRAFAFIDIGHRRAEHFNGLLGTKVMSADGPALWANVLAGVARAKAVPAALPSSARRVIVVMEISFSRLG